MSEKEKKIIEAISAAVPTMSEFSKGYLLGMGEAMQLAKAKNADETSGAEQADKA